MRINQNLVTRKCFFKRWLLDQNDKSDRRDMTAYFIRHGHSVVVKEDEVDMDMGNGEKYKAKCRYIAIDGVPCLFVIPEADFVAYTEDRKYVVNEIHGAIILNWLYENEDEHFCLVNLYKILRWLNNKVEKVLYELEYYEMKYYYVPDEIIDEIREKFIEFHYHDVFINVLHNYGYEVLEELGLLPKEDEDEEDYNDDVDEDEEEYYNDDLDEDEEDMYSSFSYYRKNNNIDLWEFYEKNEEFKNKIDEMVDDHLEYVWNEIERDRDFRDKVAEKFLKAIISDDCDEKKLINIAFHNEVERLLSEPQEGIKAFIYINSEKFEFNMIISLTEYTNIINWLQAYFSAIIGFPLLYTEKYEFWDSYYDYDVYKEILGEIKSFNVEYTDTDVYISKVIVDCVAPSNYTLGIGVELRGRLSLNKQNKRLWLHNDRIILNHLIALYKIIKGVLKVCDSIGWQRLIACGVAADYKK